MPNNTKYFPKELSWLSFNERVLQEAADENTPLIERIRFLGIYSNNLDEFYRVRVADVKRLITISQNDGELDTADELLQLLHEIQQRVKVLSAQFDDIHLQVTKALKRYNIHILNHEQLDDKQIEWVKNYFRNNVLLHVAPILLDSKVELIKRLNDSSVYLDVALYRPGRNTKYAVVEIPTNQTSRFVVLPTKSSRMNNPHWLCDETLFHTLRHFVDVTFIDFVVN